MKTVEEILKEYSDLPEFLGIELNSVNQPGHFGDSPLQVAVFRNREEVECLLRAGADPNWRGQYGYTPLHNAVSLDKPEIVKLLLEPGARVDVRKDDGRTPIDMAKSKEVRELLEAAMRKSS